jgi:hypothetical protein
MPDNSGELRLCGCAPGVFLAALNGSPRSGDAALARYLAWEINSRHRLLGAGKLTSSLPICSGHWLFSTTELRWPVVGRDVAVVRVEVVKPLQPMIADFVTGAQYAIFDDARRAVGKNFKLLKAVGNFYSALLDMFGPVVAECRGTTDIGNAVISEVRAAASRICRGQDPADEIVRVAAMLRSILGDQACLAA